MAVVPSAHRRAEVNRPQPSVRDVSVRGELELPSDLSGLVYEYFESSPAEAKEAIQRFVDDIRNR